MFDHPYASNKTPGQSSSARVKKSSRPCFTLAGTSREANGPLPRSPVLVTAPLAAQPLSDIWQRPPYRFWSRASSIAQMFARKFAITPASRTMFRCSGWSPPGGYTVIGPNLQAHTDARFRASLQFQMQALAILARLWRMSAIFENAALTFGLTFSRIKTCVAGFRLKS